jgi:hypothetical protein
MSSEWKVSTKGPFNTLTSYSIPNGMHKFTLAYQDHLTESVVERLHKTITEEVTFQLQDIFLPPWGTLHYAKTEWLRVLLQSCRRFKGHMARTEDHAWQAQTWRRTRCQMRT